jgi:hypothetical protein
MARRRAAWRGEVCRRNRSSVRCHWGVWAIDPLGAPSRLPGNVRSSRVRPALSPRSFLAHVRLSADACPPDPCARNRAAGASRKRSSDSRRTSTPCKTSSRSSPSASTLISPSLPASPGTLVFPSWFGCTGTPPSPRVVPTHPYIALHSGGPRGSGNHWLYDGGAFVLNSVRLAKPVILVTLK